MQTISAICSWVFFEVTQVCENNGTLAGCVPRGGGDLLGRSKIFVHFTRPKLPVRLRQTCANGQANAGCPSPFFGDFCQKERVQFISHDGLCVGTAANSAVCKGLAIAATSEDWPFCNPEQDCTTWNEVKKVVITIYECELGDFFADLLRFFGTLMRVILSCRCCQRCCCSLDAEELQKFLGARFFEFFRGSCVKVLDSVAFGMCVMCSNKFLPMHCPCFVGFIDFSFYLLFRLQQLKLFRYLLVPQAITFIADLSLEWLVVQNVGAAARSTETVKD